MRTPEEIIGADAVAALEAEGYEIAACEVAMVPAPSTWTDENGVVHQNEYTSVPYGVWRDLWGRPSPTHWVDAEGREHHWERMCNTFVEIIDEAGNERR